MLPFIHDMADKHQLHSSCAQDQGRQNSNMDRNPDPSKEGW